MGKIMRKQKQRLVGSEAPAIKLKMLNNEEKVIGMLAEKVQVMISLPFSDSLSRELLSLIEKYEDKAFIYLIAANAPTNKVNTANSSTDFYPFTFKYGINIDEQNCQKAIFIVNKDGEIVFRNVLDKPQDNFDIHVVDIAIDNAIRFKKKGHTHEEWMSV